MHFVESFEGLSDVGEGGVAVNCEIKHNVPEHPVVGYPSWISNDIVRITGGGVQWSEIFSANIRVSTTLGAIP